MRALKGKSEGFIYLAKNYSYIDGKVAQLGRALGQKFRNVPLSPEEAVVACQMQFLCLREFKLTSG